jgi:hypothetical protein
MTPFEAVYGQNPPSFLSYLPSVSKVQAIDQTLTVQEDYSLYPQREFVHGTESHEETSRSRSL